MKKNKDLSAVASVAAVLALLVWVGTSVVVWRSPVEGAPQESKRILHRQHPGNGEPVVITRVEADNNEVSFDQEFSAKDEWFKSLAMIVENRSVKPIVFILVGLQCPRPPGSTERMSDFDLNYGGSEILAAREGRPIAPGKSVELRLDKEDQDALGKFLKDTGYSNVSQIDVNIRLVMFADGTKWAGGRIWAPDKKTSSGWSVVKPRQPLYLASARTELRRRAHFDGCIKSTLAMAFATRRRESFAAPTTKMFGTSRTETTT